MRLPRVALAMPLLALLASPAPDAAAEGPASTAPTLGLRAGEGKSIKFVHHFVSSRQMGTDEMVEKLREAGVYSKLGNSTLEVVTELSVEVREALPEGGFRGTVRFGRCKLTETGGLQPGEMDSDRMPADDLFRSSLWSRHLAWGSSEFPVTFAADGLTAKVEGIDAAIEARVRALKIPENRVMSLRIGLTAQSISEFVDHAIAVSPFPAKPVTKGRSWTDEGVLPWVTTGKDFLAKQTFKVVHVDIPQIEIQGTGTARLVTPKIIEEAEKRLGSKISGLEKKIRDVKVSSRVVLSPTDGLPRSTETQVSFLEGETKDPMPFSCRVTAKLERIAWYSER